MTSRRSARETTTIQTWPSGRSYTFRGDPHGPANQRSLREGHNPKRNLWRKGTPAEWREIRIAQSAERILEREVYHCDSSLVDALIKRSADDGGELAEAFAYENIRGIYVDPSEWNAEQCQTYAADEGFDLPCADQYDAENPQTVDDLRDACMVYAQDHPAEVYEWWRVSSWLCEKLHEIGRVTIDNRYGCWWGRTCTGQQVIMDGVLQQVAALIDRE